MTALSATKNVALRRTLGSMCTLSLVIGLGQNVSAQVAATDKAVPKTAVRLPTTPTASPARRLLLPPRSAGLATILGSMLNMAKDPVGETVVRLRNARNGRIVASETTDKAGAFAFQRVEPGAYVAEIVGHDQSVVASSPLIGANAGEVTSIVLKLPSNLPEIIRLLGPAYSSSAFLDSQAAAGGGVAAIRGGTPVSER